MFSLPTEFLPFLEAFRQLFSVSVWASVQTLVMGAILCQGNRTVSSALRAVGLGDSPRFREPLQFRKKISEYIGTTIIHPRGIWSHFHARIRVDF